MVNLCSPTTRRGMGFFVGLMAIMVSGVSMTFATWMPNLKNQFGLQQMSLEVCASIGLFGAYSGYPAGLIYETLGSVRSYLISLVLGTVSGLLLFTTQYFIDFYSQYWGFITLYWMVYGFSTSILYMVSFAINMGNCSSQRRGLISGMSGAASMLGGAVLSAIFNSCFSYEPIGNFFLMMTILEVILACLSAWLVRPLPHLSEETNELQTLSPSQSQKQQEETEPLSLTEQYGLDLLCLPDFHILTWAYMLASSTLLVFISNVTTFSASYGLNNYNVLFTDASPMCACMSKLVCGWLSDLTIKSFPRVMYLVVLTMMQLLVLITSVFIGDNTIVLIATIMIVYATFGCYLCVMPTVIYEYFGLRHFSRNWGFLIFMNLLLTIPMTALFGVFYNDAIRDSGSNDCFGLKCFRRFYIFASMMTATSFSLLCWVYFRERKRKTPRRD